jgi:hypothetical protein
MTRTWIYRVFTCFIVFLTLKVSLSEELEVNSDLVKENAMFALAELQKLSDSKIYDTLNLKKVISASANDGVYHDNLIMKVELECPHYKSGKQIEQFEFIVMTHKTDHVKTIAIDEFPILMEDSIEEYTIKKIEEKRARRKAILRDMELESIMTEPEEQSLFDASYFQGKFSDEDVQNMFSSVETEETSSYRKMLSKSLIPKLPSVRVSDEEALMSYSLFKLYQVSRALVPSSEYQVHRSKQILRAVLGHLKKRERARQFEQSTSKPNTTKDEL